MDIPKQHFHFHFHCRPGAGKLSCCSPRLPGVERAAIALIGWVNSLFEVLPGADLD
jgi:hypothetical protein